jgi:hypothetical protein
MSRQRPPSLAPSPAAALPVGGVVLTKITLEDE